MNAVGGLRMTPSRRAILDALRAICDHPTAEEICSRVRERLPRTSLATVYRNLEQLAQSGAIRVIEDGRSQRHYDAVLSPHYHVRCAECGRLVDAPIDAQDALEREAAEASGYEITGHQLTFTGTCTECAGVRDAACGKGAHDGSQG